MATFEQNIRNIRGEAIYGPDMRESIAEAIQQTVGLNIDGNDGTVFFVLSPITGSQDEFLLTINGTE